MAKKGNKRKSHKKNNKRPTPQTRANTNNDVPKLEEVSSTVAIDEPTITSDLAKSDATLPSSSISSIEPTTENKEDFKHNEGSKQEKEQQSEQHVDDKPTTESAALDDEALLESLQVGGNIVVVNEVAINPQQTIQQLAGTNEDTTEREEEGAFKTADHCAELIPNNQLEPTPSSAATTNTIRTDNASLEQEKMIKEPLTKVNKPTNITPDLHNDIARAVFDTTVVISDKSSYSHDDAALSIQDAPTSTMKETESITADLQKQQEADPNTEVSKLDITGITGDADQTDTAVPVNTNDEKDAPQRDDVQQEPKVKNEDENTVKDSANAAASQTDKCTDQNDSIVSAVDPIIVAKTSPIITITVAPNTRHMEEDRDSKNNTLTNKEDGEKKEEQEEAIDIVQDDVTTNQTTATIITTPPEKPACTSKEEKDECQLVAPAESKQEVDHVDQQQQVERRESVTDETVTVGSHSEQSVSTAINEATVVVKGEKTSSTFIRKSRSVFLRKESDGNEEKTVTKRKSQIISLFKRNEKTSSSPLKPSETVRTDIKTNSTQDVEQKMKKRSSWMFWKSSSKKLSKTAVQTRLQ